MCFSKRSFKAEEDIKYACGDTLVILNITTGVEEVLTVDEFLKKYGV